MYNFNENPYKFQGGKMNKENDQIDIFDEKIKKTDIQITSDFETGDDRLRETGFEPNTLLSEEQKRIQDEENEFDKIEAMSKEYYDSESKWFWYTLFVNLGRGIEKRVAKIKATSPEQALYFFDEGISGIFYDNDGNVSKKKYSVYQKSDRVSVKNNPEPTEAPKRKKKKN